MKISVIGSGYVGLVTGSCLAARGFDVLCCDTDIEKINNLKSDVLPIYEPGLKELVNNSILTGHLHFTDNMKEAVCHSNALFVTVNTPTLEDNSCNLEHIFKVAVEIAKNMDSYKAIVHKSTVPVGTGHKVKTLVARILNERGCDLQYDVVSNPEFLREGSAINDFFNPDRIIIGTENNRALKILKMIYEFQLDKGTPFLETSIETAEMIKYASNAFLAAKISFINEIANICELCGADGLLVSKGMGLDKRIGPSFLDPGPGFGGSCFPKDIKALSNMAKTMGYNAKFTNCILETNSIQKERMVDKIEKLAGSLEGKVITILGLSFKPETDDIRESPSISVIAKLLEKKAIIKTYDPKAMDNMKKQYPQYPLIYCNSPYDACKESNCIAILTSWEEFCCLDFKELSAIVRNPILVDTRNMYDPFFIRSFGFYYEGVGRI
jgi:nucleotide sugar dehydrogenase